MLNSKFAPLVLITVMVMCLIAGLGYFLVIGPKLDDASSLRARRDAVRSNIVAIDTDSKSIDKAETTLKAAPNLKPVLELNAPATLQLDAFLERVSAAVKDSSSEIRSVDIDGSVDVKGWVLPASLRPSANVATYFATAPLPRGVSENPTGVDYAPVVTAQAADAPVVKNLVSVSVTISVKGHPGEVVDFVKRLTTGDNQRLFLLSSISEEARQSNSAPEAGLSAFANGDVETKVTGSLFLMNPDYAVVDEKGLGSFQLPTDRLPFGEPTDGGPQPGA